ncbi:MAG: DUF4276 family protein [Bacteroidia bacterium]
MGEKCFGRATKMRGLYIIVEGQTEEEFVKTSLQPYLFNYGINDVRPILIETSPGHKGGDLKFIRYKLNIENLLKREKDIIVTSLIDFFRLKSNFPKYDEAKNIANKNTRVTFLENSIKEIITDNRFVPYIQLHEFEGLLFSDKKGFEYVPDVSAINMQTLTNVIDQFPNPELLNDGPTTAPSKRLESLIPRYQKTLHGPLMAEVIGIETILLKCPRFKKWVENLIERMK